MSFDPSQAKSLFLQATELSEPSERAAFLERNCSGNAELQARVEALLASHNDPGSFLNQPAIQFGETPVASDATADGKHQNQAGWQPEPVDISTTRQSVSLDFLSPSERPDQLGKLGSYEILDVIGHGGMGIVLRAMDPKLNRVVAIKVLAPAWAANVMARKKFGREARAAAAVRDDHVVTIHAVVDEHPATPFLVMECIVGQSLQQKIDRVGALPLKEILRIGMQIASGLAAAHKQGLVHRDIKPANILLENGIERVKITDFGLARAINEIEMTQSGMISGTPLYMSPEQAQSLPVDHRSDLFSLGSVLYTMCTGRPAFRAEDAMAVMFRVCQTTPRSIQDLNPDLPNWLVAIVNKLMSKKVEDRNQTAKEVSELFSQHLTRLQEPDIKKHDQCAQALSGAFAHNPSWIRRSLLNRVATISVGVVVILILAVMLWFHRSDALVKVGVHSENVSVTFNNEAIKLTSGVHEYKVKPGDHTLHIKAENVEFDTGKFTLKKGENPAVTVELIQDEIVAKLGLREIGRQRWSLYGKADAASLAQNTRENGDVAPSSALSRAPKLLEGQWRVENEELVTEPIGDSTWQILTFGDVNWTDYDLRVETCCNRPGLTYSVISRFTDKKNFWHLSFGAFGPTNMDLVGAVDGEGHSHPSRRWCPNQIHGKLDVWQTVEIQTRGENIKAIIDGEVIAESHRDRLDKGCVGLHTFSGGVVRWRNLEVRQPDGTSLWKGFPQLPAQ